MRQRVCSSITLAQRLGFAFDPHDVHLPEVRGCRSIDSTAADMRNVYTPPTISQMRRTDSPSRNGDVRTCR